MVLRVLDERLPPADGDDNSGDVDEEEEDDDDGDDGDDGGGGGGWVIASVANEASPDPKHLGDPLVQADEDGADGIAGSSPVAVLGGDAEDV